MTPPIFSHEMKVRDYECDAQGHVNNANYQHYFEVARHEFLESLGLNFFQLHLQGIDLVVSRVEIRYKIPLLGGEIFRCTVQKIELHRVKYNIFQEIVRVSDGSLCAKGKIEFVSRIDGKLSNSEQVDQALAPYLTE